MSHTFLGAFIILLHVTGSSCIPVLRARPITLPAIVLISLAARGLPTQNVIQLRVILILNIEIIVVLRFRRLRGERNVSSARVTVQRLGSRCPLNHA